jgi:hypothetical protein
MKLKEKAKVVAALSAESQYLGDAWHLAYERGDLTKCREIGARRMALLSRISEILHREPSLIERIWGWIFGGQWVMVA